MRPRSEAPAADAPLEQAAAETAAETVAVGDAPDANAAATTAPDAVAAPEMVEVWRPGGRSEERRPRHDRSRHRPQERAGSPGRAAAARSEAADGAKRERHGRGRRDRSNDFRKLRANAPAAAATPAADGAPRRGRAGVANRARTRAVRRASAFRARSRDNDKGKFGGGRDKGGRDKGGRDKRPDGGPSHRQFATSAPPRERDRPIDPNSPFAKLAALQASSSPPTARISANFAVGPRSGVAWSASVSINGCGMRGW